MPDVSILNIVLNNPVCSALTPAPTGLIYSVTEVNNNFTNLPLQSPNE